MLVKLLSSRKALFQIFSKIITVYLLMTIKDAMWQVILFVVSTVADFVYFNELNFEKVKTEVTLKTP